jgi:hypothetical protein
VDLALQLDGLAPVHCHAHEGTKVSHLVLAWAWFGIPLTLGVVQTLINSMKVFQ